jgi:DNA-binding HxlR family transcriptional regulator
VNTALESALAVVGDRWSFLVLWDVGLGVDRFTDLLAMTGAPRAVLADRIHALTDKGLVASVAYREPGRRARSRYVLTPSGADFRLVLAAMSAWGERYDDGEPETRVTDRHRGCGGHVRARLVCDCGVVVTEPYDVLTEVPTEGAA